MVAFHAIAAYAVLLGTFTAPREKDVKQSVIYVVDYETVSSMRLLVLRF